MRGAEEIGGLEKKLKTAVASEDYEMAARYRRYQIRALREGTKDRCLSGMSRNAKKSRISLPAGYVLPGTGMNMYFRPDFLKKMAGRW